MREIYRLALPRAMTIVLVQLAAVVLGIGYLDYSRGAPVPATVPVCTGNCVPLPEGAVRAVLDADLDGGRRIEALFGTRNLCALPPLYLVGSQLNDDLLRLNEALSVTGIAEITQADGDWLLRPGHAIDSRADILRKLFDPAYAEKSCERPWFRFYGYLALVLLSAAFLATYLAPAREKP